MGGVHFASLRGRLLLVLPHAQGTHSSDEFFLQCSHRGPIRRQSILDQQRPPESPDDDTPRPPVQDDGLLGPRLRWKLFPPPLTLFTAPVLLGWRHLPQADSFFWRKDVEDSALARYSTTSSADTLPGRPADDAAPSSDSHEEVLIEEPGTERPLGSEATYGIPEDELPMSVQAGDITLCSHDYQADPDEATRRHSCRRSRQTPRRRPRSSRSRSPALSAKAPRTTRTLETPVPAEPASSSRVEASSQPSSALPGDLPSTTSSTSARPSKWTIPQWARKAINKRVREKQANQPPEPLPPRPQGRSIWFVSDDIDEPALSKAGSSCFS